MAMLNDTIYALSSGAPPSGVSVVRISGRSTRDILVRLVGSVPVDRVASYRTIRNRNNRPVDSGLVLFFPAPHSFTGEDVAELQIHGSKAVLAALFNELGDIPNVRMAIEGEFSRRAFENGKLDLVEVEGLADLISAETEMQRRLAVEQSAGGVSAIYDSWAERLTRARALIEAELDFPDEDDVPGSVSDMVWTDMKRLRDDIGDHLKAASAGEIIRDGFKVVIAGAPNAGKSSLLNALARRDVAIVTDIAGTTRDVLQVDLDIDGYLVKLYDTAGLREADDRVEIEGVRRARVALRDADLALLLVDMSNPVIPGNLEQALPHVTVGTKKDLIEIGSGGYDLEISTATGDGLPELRQLIGRIVAERFGGLSLAIPSRQRHRDSLAKCLAALDAAISETDADLELRTEQLRLAAEYIGRITGRVDVEQLLDVIFSEFCIGK
ncbi:tRNA uridine-5-carboxymethylaminomethyl(34) synthesis GTPase MnmE [Rhizobium bangladeshense]|uniref:tRNA uridine-5-carboxymethylaminomethyl(34) synthesis GTPase MnmE n=1 Tax=Rhizobium bangladeshense TaxID=1138189 RepID=UPI001C82D9FC|nr:tRNA uridine-5-carboxymethylaminomethyl(34) synthesis GTPase MnmE [Rhizobium bangladeshense]MBX4869190.1 tRNA uridine-5-carboxymethylaminomethyl(34) synthesis GTPase MnmE [Rhizobium bangladeshense]MBX4872973.1 tRNA uridine-5-carboxymethylaminomethyl(34) synthesis GTPase MnmE [Rhizobium bangladeshense]MBX4884350.1 tRNA uridine-5-carboxymethylaminomethyl(34) synthesis GTPase MnmE [Rhizobium bangladeshense]